MFPSSKDLLLWFTVTRSPHPVPPDSRPPSELLPSLFPLLPFPEVSLSLLLFLIPIPLLPFSCYPSPSRSFPTSPFLPAFFPLFPLPFLLFPPFSAVLPLRPSPSPHYSLPCLTSPSLLVFRFPHPAPSSHVSSFTFSPPSHSHPFPLFSLHSPSSLLTPRSSFFSPASPASDPPSRLGVRDCVPPKARAPGPQPGLLRPEHTRLLRRGGPGEDLRAGDGCAGPERPGWDQPHASEPEGSKPLRFWAIKGPRSQGPPVFRR